MPPEVFFAGPGIDRADALRGQPEQMGALARSPEARQLVWADGLPALDAEGRLIWEQVADPALFLGRPFRLRGRTRLGRTRLGRTRRNRHRLGHRRGVGLVGIMGPLRIVDTHPKGQLAFVQDGRRFMLKVTSVQPSTFDRDTITLQLCW